MPERAALITALMLERPLCLPCAITTTGLSRGAVDVLIARIQSALVIHRSVARCDACGQITQVLFFNRPTVKSA
jgi:hypothetical protein